MEPVLKTVAVEQKLLQNIMSNVTAYSVRKSNSSRKQNDPLFRFFILPYFRTCDRLRISRFGQVFPISSMSTKQNFSSDSFLKLRPHCDRIGAMPSAKSMAMEGVYAQDLPSS